MQCVICSTNALLLRRVYIASILLQKLYTPTQVPAIIPYESITQGTRGEKMGYK